MKGRTLWILGAALCSLVAAGPAAAADAKAGRALHDARCLKCHGVDLYTLPKRKVTSLEALKKQVERCAKAAETGWTEAQTADVVEYMNEAFYQFK